MIDREGVLFIDEAPVHIFRLSVLAALFIATAISAKPVVCL
jgi:hypothetical protein